MTRNSLWLLVIIAAGAFVTLGCPDPEPECQTDADCEVGTICKDGACVEPDCGEIYDPVCGEDGETYANPCEARAAHVAVAHEGECQQVCGGPHGIPCPANEICDLPAGMCDGVDLEGVCVEIPVECPEIFDPVCGCDGVTYSNDCFRLMAGAQLDHPGECEPMTTDEEG